MATSDTSTYFPVGATPGSIQSISRSCVKQNSISSTLRSEPMVREIGMVLVSAGFAKRK
jgi:hypothetical protein